MSYADAQYGLKDKVHDVFKKEIPTVQEGTVIQNDSIGADVSRFYPSAFQKANNVFSWRI